MMLLRAYSLHDVKALNYSPPFFQHNNGLATRMLQDLVNDQGTSVGRHPADFKLYCVGVFDDSNGSFQPFPAIEHVMDAIALVGPSQSEMFGQRKE